MMRKQFQKFFTLPFKLARLITSNRLERLWYYIRSNQSEIILDRIKRLLELGTAAPMPLQLYSTTYLLGPLQFPIYESPLVSIIIPVYNHWETTRACLISILEKTTNIPYEVIVADDGSQDKTHLLAELAPGVHHVANKENLGFLLNCNKGSENARGKYLVLLNNDTQVQTDWLAPLLKLAEQDELVGVVGPMLLYPDGRLQEAGGIVWQDGSAWNYGRLDYPEKPEYNYVKEVDYISGACILVRKSMWDEIGGFDKRFTPAYYEDTDLAFEARHRGFKVLYQPLSRVVHLEGISHGTDLNLGIKFHQAVNKATFRDKWSMTLDAKHGLDPRDLRRSRDRSLDKKHLLFIDHYVPMRDQDAGSKSTFQYLLLMLQMGYQITFLGDNFVDHQPYTSELQQLGIEVLYGPGLQRNWKRWVSINGKNFDYIYLSRPHITRKYLPHIRRHSSAKLIYCGHDLHFLREERRYQLEGKIAYRQAAKKWSNLEESILQQVDIGYFFSSFEVKEVRRRFQNVIVREIPLYLFNELETADLLLNDYSERKGLLFVGGFMHAPNVDAVKWFVGQVFPLIRQNLPGISLTVVGSNPPLEITRLASAHIHVTGRISDEALLNHYNNVRLVVAPLRFGAGVKGKIVEAMHRGVPVVTTSIGAEGIGDCENALFIADEPGTFADTVTRAYIDQEQWITAQYLSSSVIKKYFSKESARAILSQDMPL